MPLRPLFHFGAGLGAAVDEIKQAADFLDGEAELAGAQDEAQAGDVALVIDAVSCSVRGGSGIIPIFS